MKKFISILSVIAVFTTLTACNVADDAGEATITEIDTETTTTTSETTSATSEKKAPKETHIPVAITPSPDKYTWYIKDYVGKNCAAIGYTGTSGRWDSYGQANIKLNLIADDSSFIDVDDEEELKKYYVTGQSIEPNTEMKLTIKESEGGWEYVDYQSIEEIDLYVSLVE